MTNPVDQSASFNSPVDQAFFSSQRGQRSDIVEIEFVHEVGPVFFNRFDADTEKVCNLLVLMTFGNQLENLPFPLGQSFPRGSNRGRFFPLQKAVDDHT